MTFLPASVACSAIITSRSGFSDTALCWGSHAVMHVTEWAQAEWDHELDMSWLSMMSRATHSGGGAAGGSGHAAQAPGQPGGWLAFLLAARKPAGEVASWLKAAGCRFKSASSLPASQPAGPATHKLQGLCSKPRVVCWPAVQLQPQSGWQAPQQVARPLNHTATHTPMVWPALLHAPPPPACSAAQPLRDMDAPVLP